MQATSGQSMDINMSEFSIIFANINWTVIFSCFIIITSYFKWLISLAAHPGSLLMFFKLFQIRGIM